MKVILVKVVHWTVKVNISDFSICNVFPISVLSCMYEVSLSSFPHHFSLFLYSEMFYVPKVFLIIIDQICSVLVLFKCYNSVYSAIFFVSLQLFPRCLHTALVLSLYTFSLVITSVCPLVFLLTFMFFTFSFILC